MKKYLIIMLTLSVMAWGGEIQYLSANEGHHEEHGSGHMDDDGGHGNGEHEHEESSSSKATKTKVVNKYQYSLSISPENPKSGFETELNFEITDMRGAEDNFGDGYPVTDIEPAITVKNIETKQQKTVHAHGEGDAGVYGIHYEFPSAGDYLVSLEWKDSKGNKYGVDFNVHDVAKGSASHGSEKGHDEEKEESGHGGGGHHH